MWWRQQKPHNTSHKIERSNTFITYTSNGCHFYFQQNLSKRQPICSLFAFITIFIDKSNRKTLFFLHPKSELIMFLWNVNGYSSWQWILFHFQYDDSSHPCWMDGANAYSDTRTHQYFHWKVMLLMISTYKTQCWLVCTGIENICDFFFSSFCICVYLYLCVLFMPVQRKENGDNRT